MFLARNSVRSMTLAGHGLTRRKFGPKTEKIGNLLTPVARKVSKIEMIKEKFSEFKIKHLRSRMDEPTKRSLEVIEEHREFI